MDTVAAAGPSVPGHESRTVTEILPGKIYAVGGYIPADRPLSWIARDSKGWLPVQCYAVRDGEFFILVDTGLIVHKDAIQSALGPLVGDSEHRHLMLTRREPDTMMNLPWIVRQFDIQSVRCCGPIDPFDLVEKLDEAHTSAHVKAAFGVSVDFLTPGSTTHYDRMSLSIMRPGVRILATDWMYEASTGTLFSSDSWAFVTRPSRDAPAIVRDDGDHLSVAAIKAHLSAKFDWLCGIETASMADELRAVFEKYDIARLCPSYGCVIEGGQLVRAVLDRTLQAMDELGREPRPKPMGDFSWLDRSLLGCPTICPDASGPCLRQKSSCDDSIT